MNIIDRETFAAMEAVRKAGARPAVKKYSTLKIIRALGDEWPVYRDQLESGGYADQFFAANYLAGDDPVFVSFLANVPDSVKTKLAECEWSAE